MAYAKWAINRLPANSPHRPKMYNDWYKDDDPKDLLSYLGIRKRYVSDASRGGLYHLNSGPAMPRRERDPDAKFSESFFQTMKENASYSANKERHEALKFHQKLVKLDNLIGRRAYIVSQIRLADEALKSGTSAVPLLPPTSSWACLPVGSSSRWPS